MEHTEEKGGEGGELARSDDERALLSSSLLLLESPQHTGEEEAGRESSLYIFLSYPSHPPLHRLRTSTVPFSSLPSLLLHLSLADALLLLCLSSGVLLLLSCKRLLKGE